MQLKYEDNKGYFGEGDYLAKISRVENYKTKYGNKLLLWMSIRNKFDREMLINDFIPPYCTSDNLTGKIFRLVNSNPDDHVYDTDKIINKHITITLVKRIKRGKSYLNVCNYSPASKSLPTSQQPPGDTNASPAETIAALLRSNPDLAQAVSALIKPAASPARQKKLPATTKKISAVITDIQNQNGGN
jgi:hypothetical protein